MLLERGQLVAKAGTECEWVIFPDSGIVSVVSNGSGERQLEVGLFGREGMGPAALVLGGDRSPFLMYVQVPGHGHRMKAQDLTRAMAEFPEFRENLLRFTQAFMAQVAQTASSNGCCTIEQRLARWLLLVHDRSDGDEVVLTHEFLSIMLGVRRTGVTLAIHVLEGERMICARRGSITILDRDRLAELAGPSYGLAEAEYERLIGPMEHVLRGVGGEVVPAA